MMIAMKITVLQKRFLGAGKILFIGADGASAPDFFQTRFHALIKSAKKPLMALICLKFQDHD